MTDALHHSAHTTHATHVRHSRSRTLFFGRFSDHDFRCDHESSNRARCLECRSCHLGGIQNTHTNHVTVLTRGRVVTEVAFTLTDFVENNGGFSSVRSEWGERDLSAFGSMTLRCRTTMGESDTFTLTMETSEQWWMPYWKANFTAGPAWSEVTLDFADLKKSSAMTGDLPKLWSWGALDDILRVGMMKYDGLAGDFGLEVDWVRFNPNQPVRN